VRSGIHDVQEHVALLREGRDGDKADPPGQGGDLQTDSRLRRHHLAARRVAWLLHSSARKYRLPWQRVVGSNGRVSLKPGYGYEEQRRLLRLEGVGFRRDGSIDLERYLWRPSVRGPAPGGSRRSKRGDRPA
jgi:methylated-DNA-protein-cysteine methyltransferase-like protein